MTPPSGDTENGPWTNFWQMNPMLDHLSEELYLEAFDIMEQPPPYARTPRTFMEHAFFNEEHFRPDRTRLQKEEDDRRVARMLELGVISTEGDPIYDWTEVQAQD